MKVHDFIAASLQYIKKFVNDAQFRESFFYKCNTPEKENESS